MVLQEAKTLANQLMCDHGLYDWNFSWHNAKTIIGTCYHKRKEIKLSKLFTKQLEESKVRNTILHEIAHALVGGGHGHNYVWKNKAREIGCNANRYSSYNIEIQAKYKATCKSCGMVHTTHRRTKRNHWCKCNNRSFNPEMILEYIQQY